MRITRRTALQTIGAAAITPVLGACTPGGDGSSSTSSGSTSEPTYLDLVRDRIKHVVVLMMENRSFDHYFGALKLGGRDDVDGLSAGMSNPLSNGMPVTISPADAFCITDPAHGWDASHHQFNMGANDGFVREHEGRVGASDAHRVMGYFDGTKLSAFYGLLGTSVLCQRWHASVMGPTWPNRYHLLATTSMGRKTNMGIPGFVPNIFDSLNQKHIDWANHYGNIPFSILLDGQTLDDPAYRYLEEFHDDAMAGNLPPFTLIDPIYGRNDDHPPTHPVAGQILVQSIYTSLAQSPHWNDCLFMVMYDEHGGFFDHVAPGTTEDDFASDGFNQLGFRVPAMVMGPYVKQNHVDSVVRDHTSVYRTLQELWDLPDISLREKNAKSVIDLLDEDRIRAKNPAAAVTLNPIIADDAEIHAEQCNGQRFFPRPGSGGITGQRELEVRALERFEGHAKLRLAQTELAYERFLDVARLQGVLRRG